MKNLIILGSGRSGTSMLAGCFQNCGYWYGNDLIPSRDGNPKGFFESNDINQLNEDILEPVLRKRPPVIGRWFVKKTPLEGQSWLIPLPTNISFKKNRKITNHIKDVTVRQPYCFKDPRFYYTLPAWYPYLENIVFICIFRNPIKTVNSIFKEVENEEYLKDLKISFNRALQVWIQMYKHVLEKHRNRGQWLFLHYDQLFSKECLERLETLTQASVDYSFPDSQLDRSRITSIIPSDAKLHYSKLCDLAGFYPNDE